jgi:hypothetical protein
VLPSIGRLPSFVAVTRYVSQSVTSVKHWVLSLVEKLVGVASEWIIQLGPGVAASAVPDDTAASNKSANRGPASGATRHRARTARTRFLLIA